MECKKPMTVTEYRKKYPNCDYCKYHFPAFDFCSATRKRMSKRTAKKCPCYVPSVWYDPEITEKRLKNEL